MLEGAGDDGRIVGVDLAEIALQEVENPTKEQELKPARLLSLQGKTEYVVELRKLESFTILDSRACIPTHMMLLENTYRDSFHIGADKGLKELQCHRCRKEPFHKSKTKNQMNNC